METIIPRYEFRTFAQDLNEIEQMIRQLAPCDRIRESEELYILSDTEETINCKIRHQLLDIKKLLLEEHGLEQWKPIMKFGFPVTAEHITNQIFPILNLPAPELNRDSYTLNEFINELIQRQTELQTIKVSKKRYGFRIGECTIDYAEVVAEEIKIHTIAVESTEPQAVLSMCEQLHLNSYGNISYPQELKRITGLVF